MWVVHSMILVFIIILHVDHEEKKNPSCSNTHHMIYHIYDWISHTHTTLRSDVVAVFSFVTGVCVGLVSCVWRSVHVGVHVEMYVNIHLHVDVCIVKYVRCVHCLHCVHHHHKARTTASTTTSRAKSRAVSGGRRSRSTA